MNPPHSTPKPCWECLRRRLVCDLGRPTCKKCRDRDVECPGYDKKPLKWLQPGQTRSKGRRAKKESNVIRLGLKDTTEVTTLFEAIEYYNVRVCPDLIASGSSARSPFFMPLAEAPFIPAPIRHSIVSIALAHRILQSEQGFESDRAVLSTRLQTHRGAAIRHLAGHLKPGSQASGLTLASILTFLLAELQQSFSPDWRQHCDAAHAVIDQIGGIQGLFHQWPWFQHLFRYFALVEIIGTTTSPVVDQGRARRQLELIGLIPQVFGVGLETSLPCPPELLAHIILVNNLRATQANSPVLERQQHISAVNLLNSILEFSVHDWATNIKLNEQLSEDADKSLAQRRKESLDWQSLAYIYQSTVALYCISALFDPNNGQAEVELGPADSANKNPDTAALRLSHLDALLSNLRDIASNPNTQLRKLVIWPTVVAGIEVDANDDASKAFILHELAWASKALGTASPLIAQELLRKLWVSDEARTGRQRSWGDVFDRPYAFVI
ncbi:hypothetical protein ACJ41O_014613 [Fusarium nematophilum]